MRIAVCQINPKLGDFEYNRQLILEYIKKSNDHRAELVIFPEAAAFGYHPFDLLERKEAVERQLKQIEVLKNALPAGLSVILGAFTINSKKKGRPYFNSALLLQKGKATKTFNKQLLPTGDVFDEARFIEAGQLKNNFVKINNKMVFISICEDIWAWPNEKGISPYTQNPIADIKSRAVDLVVNLSASPFFAGKAELRNYVVAKTAKHFKAPMVYCNIVGGQDEIVFDGGSFVVNKSGKTMVQMAAFEQDFKIIDLPQLNSMKPKKRKSPTEELREALVLGIRDFCVKTGLQKVHLGLSGGIDSAVVACLAVDALGPSCVSAVAMPGPFSANESRELAVLLSKNLGIKIQSIDITSTYQVAKTVIDQAFSIEKFGLVHENLQARLRGMFLMALANQQNSLLLTTSNKTEYASGYSTLYGDMCGGLAPIGDLTKGQVIALAKLYNKEMELIPSRIISRPPTAELRENQTDQDTLPPYDQLDKAVIKLVENAGAVGTAADKWLLPVLMRTEFKRWQAPPIIKVSSHSFGRGRRWPIAFKY